MKCFFSTGFVNFQNIDFSKQPHETIFQVSIVDEKYTWDINEDKMTHAFECNYTNGIACCFVIYLKMQLLPSIKMFWF